MSQSIDSNTTIPFPVQSRVRSVCITPPCQQAHRDLMASLSQLTPHNIVGHEADRFDVLERADHLKAVLGAVYAYAKVIVGDTKDYITVFLADETGYLSDASSEINGAFMNACDRMLDAQIEAAE
jgi:hypothetical protein